MINAHDFNELLKYEGETFVDRAYMAVLQRKPDDLGKKAVMEDLAKGISKERVLLNLRLSQEGLSKNIQIAGFPEIRCTLNDFYSAKDEEFLDFAYLVFLGRTADQASREELAQMMDRGAIDRWDVLKGLAESEERKRSHRKIEIAGLSKLIAKRKIRNGLCRIPFLGSRLRERKILKNRINKLLSDSREVEKGNIYQQYLACQDRLNCVEGMSKRVCEQELSERELNVFAMLNGDRKNETGY